mgnify:CR=1 FL=1
MIFINIKIYISIDFPYYFFKSDEFISSFLFLVKYLSISFINIIFNFPLL